MYSLTCLNVSFFQKRREGGVGIIPRTLRVSVYSSHNQGKYVIDGAGAVPEWTLRIEGKILDEPGRPPVAAKFSQFIKRLSVELDSSEYRTDNFIEWDHRRQGEGTF